MVTAFTVLAAFAVPESFASEFAQRRESDLYNRDDLSRPSFKAVCSQPC